MSKNNEDEWMKKENRRSKVWKNNEDEWMKKENRRSKVWKNNKDEWMKKENRRSKVWKNFLINKGKNMVKCNICNHVLKFSGSTSGMIYHNGSIHLMSKTSKKYQCFQCLKRFKSKASLNQHKEALHKDTNHNIEPKLKNLKNIKEFSQPRENLEDILLKRINEENLPKPCKLIYEKELYLSWDEQFCFFRFKESNIEVAHFLVPENDDFNIDEKKDSFSYQNFEGAFQRLIELLRSIGNINKSRIDDQRKKS